MEDRASATHHWLGCRRSPAVAPVQDEHARGSPGDLCRLSAEERRFRGLYSILASLGSGTYLLNGLYPLFQAWFSASGRAHMAIRWGLIPRANLLYPAYPGPRHPLSPHLSCPSSESLSPHSCSNSR